MKIALAFVLAAAGAAAPAAASTVAAPARAVYVGLTHGGLDPQAAEPDLEEYTIAVDGDRFELTLVNEEVVHAEHNGAPVDPARVLVRDGRILIKKKDGGTLFEGELQRSGKNVLLRRLGPGQPAGFASFSAGVRPQLLERLKAVDSEEVAAPKVMMGVTLARPGRELAGHLGLSEETGVLLLQVAPGTPADQAGLKAYDVLLEVDGAPARDESAIRSAIRTKNPGDELRLRVVQRGAPKDVVVKLVAFDDAKMNPLGWGVTANPAEEIEADLNAAARAMAEARRAMELRSARGALAGPPSKPGVKGQPGVPKAEAEADAEATRAWKSAIDEIEKDFPMIFLDKSREQTERRLEAIDERLARLEMLIERLARGQGAAPTPPAPPAPPAPGR